MLWKAQLNANTHVSLLCCGQEPVPSTRGWARSPTKKCIFHKQLQVKTPEVDPSEVNNSCISLPGIHDTSQSACSVLVSDPFRSRGLGTTHRHSSKHTPLFQSCDIADTARKHTVLARRQNFNPRLYTKLYVKRQIFVCAKLQRNSFQLCSKFLNFSPLGS